MVKFTKNKKTTLRQAAIRLFLVAMMCIPWVTQAQELLTVHDGSATSGNVPVHGLWADAYLKCEMVYPADELSEMSGGTISGMTFYLTSPAAAQWTGTFQVFIKEVSDATLSAYSGTTDATVVYEGTLDATGSTMTVTFSQDYTYGGENLLVGVYQIVKGGYKSATFAGESVTGASGQGYNSSSLDNVSFAQKNFLPKTTFSYTPPVGGCDMPTSIAVTDGTITSSGATVTWDGTGSEWNLRYKASTDADYTYVNGLTVKTYTFNTLAENTTYSVGVQTVCSSNTSSFRSTSFTTADPCAAPTNFQATNITPDGATISWTAGYQETEWIVEYKKSSEAWENAVSETVNDNPTITLSHLDGLTTYNVRVKNCGAVTYSYLDGNFTTAAGIPLNETFDATSLPTAWARYSGLLSDVMGGTALTAYSGGWNFNTGNGVFDSHARVNIYGANCKYWLVTPNLVMEDNVQLTFDMALTKYSGTLQPIDNTLGDDDKFVVLITTDGGTNWTVLRQWDNAGSADVYNDIACSATGQAVAIDLSSYAGQSIAIAFYGESTVNETGSDNYLHIDNVSIDYIPSCAKPTGFSVSNVDGHNATLNWTAGGSETAWVVAYKTAAETDFTEVDVTTNPYTIEHLTPETAYNVKIRANCGGTYSEWTNTINFTTTIACPAPTALTGTPDVLDATITWTSTATEWDVAYSEDNTADPEANIVATVTTNSYTMTNLALRDHYFWVRSRCGSEDGNSSWTGPVTVHIGYCVPNPTSHDGQGITGVSFGTGSYVVENGDGTASVPATAPYYGDYTSMIGAVQAGVESTIAITTSTGSYPYTFVIWVDLDNSLSFEDSEVFYVGKASSGNGTLNATITIPATQATGDYRMRIYGADSYFNSFYNNGTTDWTKAHDPCVSGTYRHAHDYTLRVLEAPSCLTPTSLTITYTGGDEAEVSWDGTATTYNIDVNGTVTNDVTNPYTLTGLSLATTYAVTVQANCGSAGTSEWSAPQSFTTDLCLPADMCEINYSFTDQYDDSWNGASIDIVDVATSTVIANVTMPSVTGPYTGTVNVCNGREIQFVWNSGSYDNECGYTFTDVNGDPIFTGSGAMSAPVNYTASCSSCRKVSALTVSNITDNSATLSWTESGTATAWQICINGDESNLIYVTEETYSLTNLEQDLSYTVKVRAYCDATEQSAWSETTFSTLVLYPKPTGLNITSYTNNSVTLGWTDNTGSDGYNVRYRVLDAASNQSFEAGLSGWTTIDADGDGYTWVLGSEAGSVYLDGSASLYGTDHSQEGDMICSGSYSNVDGALYPDNYLVSPQITLGGSISFYACAQDNNYPAEYFGVAVSTTGNTEATDFTTIAEWTMDANGGPGAKTQGLWKKYTVDLSAYSGQGYVAIRHFNCTNEFILNIDDISIVQPGYTETPWTPTSSTTTSATVSPLTPEVTYEFQVQSIYGSNTSQWTASKCFAIPYTFTKNVEANKWYAISSPVHNNSNNENIADVTNLVTTGTDFAFDLYRYNEGDGTWENYKNNTHTDFDVLERCRGYIYRRSVDAELAFHGNPNSGTFKGSGLTFSCSDADLKGFHLVGNPYEHVVYKGNAFGTNYVDGWYALQPNGTWMVKENSNPIAAGEAVLVKISLGLDQNYNTFNDVSTPSSAKSFQSFSLPFTVSNGEYKDVTYATFNSNREGLTKIGHLDANAPALCIPVNGEKYAIAMLGDNCEEFEMNFRANAGNYTISVNLRDMIETNGSVDYLHLIDRATGADIDLLRTNSYSFDHSGSQSMENRFVVKLSGDSEISNNFARWNGSAWVIEGNGMLQIFDVLGRSVMNSEVQNATEIHNSQFPAVGVYILRLGDKSQKIVVK